MIKKILMVTMLWLSFTESTLAKDVNFTISARAWENSITVTTSAFIESFSPNPKDWVAIYKVGDSNVWANVKLWTWAKDFQYVEDGYGELSYQFKDVKLPSGRYEARYFLNNTFTTRLASKPFTVASDETYGYYTSKNDSLYIEVYNKNFSPNSKDWIGIYKQDDSNAWKNVRKWIWAKNLKKSPDNSSYFYQFKNPSLSNGKYEVRYFLNNTFTTHKQSRVFDVQVDTNNTLHGYYRHIHKTLYIGIADESFNPNPKDWFGIYKVGSSNDWSNVKKWIWAKDVKKSPAGYYYRFRNTELSFGEYELRYFLNNTFTVNQTSKPFNAR